MNKIVHLCFAMLPFLAISQNQLPVDSASAKVLFKEIFEFDSTYTSDQLYKSAKEWYLTSVNQLNRSSADKNFNAGNMLLGAQKSNSSLLDQLYLIEKSLVLEEPEDKKLIGKGVLKYSGGTMGCIRIFYLNFDVKTFIKDSRMKIEITNFTYNHYNQVSMTKSQIYGWNDSGPCMSQNTIESLMTCDRCAREFEKFYTYIKEDMPKIMISIKEYIQANKPTAEKDDW
jgi:hypothetical protein